MTAPLSQERLEQIRVLVAENEDWCREFRDGMFHVHCHKCGTGEPYLPPEFFGLVKAVEDLTAALKEATA